MNGGEDRIELDSSILEAPEIDALAETLGVSACHALGMVVVAAVRLQQHGAGPAEHADFHDLTGDDLAAIAALRSVTLRCVTRHADRHARRDADSVTDRVMQSVTGSVTGSVTVDHVRLLKKRMQEAERSRKYRKRKSDEKASKRDAERDAERDALRDGQRDATVTLPVTLTVTQDPSLPHTPTLPQGLGLNNPSDQEQELGTTPRAHAHAGEDELAEAVAQATQAGRVCRRLVKAGLGRVNPSFPPLVDLLAAGVTEQAIVDTARELLAFKADASLGYLCATLQRRMNEPKYEVKKTPKPASHMPAKSERRTPVQTTSRAAEEVFAKLGIGKPGVAS